MTNDSWVLNLWSWVVQDGDFADLECGQEATFGVELWPDPDVTNLAAASPATNSSRPLASDRRTFVGELVFVGDEGWAIDAGLLMCGSRALPVHRAKVGDRFRGEGRVEVLPTAVDVEFGAAPPHLYSWGIQRIELETTPWIQTGPKSWEQDPNKVSYRDVNRTNGWDDDDGRAHYLLHCSLLSGPVT